MERASDDRVGRPPGANISDGFGGFAVTGSKDLALVDNTSGSRGSGWGQFGVPQRLLGKVRRNLRV